MRVFWAAAVALGCVAITVQGLWAHEVQPTIGDIAVSGATLTLDLELNAEAFVAGVDLEGVRDINATPEAEAYDALRALPADALSAQFAPVAARMASEIKILLGDGSPVPLRFLSAQLGSVGDVETLRESSARFVAQANRPIDGFELVWPDGYGTLILRQVGVENGFTGFLDGGTSSGLIAAGDGTPPSRWSTFFSFIQNGFDNVIPRGWALILLSLGFFFLSPRIDVVLWQIAGFTLSYAIAAQLAAFGWGGPSRSVWEPIIAATLVCIALQNIVSPHLSYARVLVVLIAGIVFGMGVAPGLSALGWPNEQGGVAVAGFTVGIALGMLTTVSLAYLLIGHWFGQARWYRRAIAVPASFVIALIGSYWVLAGGLSGG